MSLIRPTAALALSGEPIVREQAAEHPLFIRPRRAAEAPEATAAEDASDDTPATRSDVARLEVQLAELVAREEERAAALARIEDAALCCLLAVEALRKRMDRWDAETTD